jgi:hypothetical protein
MVGEEMVTRNKVKVDKEMEKSNKRRRGNVVSVAVTETVRESIRNEMMQKKENNIKRRRRRTKKEKLENKSNRNVE